MKSITATLFSLFLLCAFTTAQDVLDIDGDVLQNGGSYFLLPVFPPDGGGIGAFQSENEDCPITVAQEPLWPSKGLPVKFSSPLKIPFIRVGDALTVRFTYVPWCAPTPSQWTVLEGSKEVKLTGYNNTIRGSFHIENAVDDGDYTLSFCPFSLENGTCEGVAGLRGPLVVSSERIAIKVKFQKISDVLGETNHHVLSSEEQ